MSAPLSLRFALLCGLLVAARFAFPVVAEEVASSESAGWTDAQVAEHAAQLAGPETIAVVHFQTADSDAAPCVASWFDRFEKRIAGETLEEFGVREAVVAIDAGSFGVLSTRAVVGMNADYLRDPQAEAELRALFAPLGEEVAFQERTIHIASDSRNADVDRATLNVRCIEKRLAAVGEAPLRLVTVEPLRSEDRESFVSLPESPAEASSGTCLALAFDYRTSTGTLRLVSGDESAIELRIDEASGRAPAFRAFARMARVTLDRVLPAEMIATDAAPESAQLAEIVLPPFGLPSAR